jgi:hypothetical protein
MSRFEVLAGEVVIGYSDLEGGDPPMGVAFGSFQPTAEYASIRHLVLGSGGRLVEELNLSVRVRSGRTVHAEGGVVIEDYSFEGLSGDITVIEVAVFGVPYPLYRDLFPAHVAAYTSSSINDVHAA